jgi:hypothetical protein
MIYINLMCYNKETSITTYVIGSIASLYLIYKKDEMEYKIIGGFFLYVIQMQMIEYLLWNHRVKCDKYNINISTIGSILNHLQPIVLFLLIKNLNPIIYEKNKRFIDLLLGVYIVNLLLYSLNIYPMECTTLDNSNHLYWKWNHKKNGLLFYIIFIVVQTLLSYLGFIYPFNIVFVIILLGSFLISKYIYGDTKAVGAIWCWYAALVPVFIMIFNLIK